MSPPSYSFFWFGCFTVMRRTEVDMFIFISLGCSFQEINLSYGGRGKDTHCLIQDEKLLLM